jgi:hypothetical protein
MFTGFHAKVFQDFFYVLRLSKPKHFMLLISQYLDSKKKNLIFLNLSFQILVKNILSLF